MWPVVKAESGVCVGGSSGPASRQIFSCFRGEAPDGLLKRED